ncbi:MAG: hypothetical protein MK183_11380, partial [Verrucomicrobiales bacterium]|nr:hypothetical protein [Verrucomicrobiales bacterium]
MNIWTTVGTSLVIMVISTLLVLGDKIIGQDAKTPPPPDIPPLQAPEAETSNTPFDQDAFEIQQDIILKLSQRIAELEAAEAQKKNAAVDDDVDDDTPETALPLEEEEEFVPSALPLENPAPAPSPAGPLPKNTADIPLNEFSPYPEARQDYGEALDPYGEWFATEEYGDVWQPSTIRHDTGWSPYTNGSWHSTDLGWHFTSSDPWGWACYHYGRWVRYHHIGWCWIPGRQWAPAWVSWRVSDHHVGWCPLPPSATWSHNVGIGHWVDARCNLGPSHYNFVSITHFGHGHCRPRIIDRRTNFSLILSTRNITLIAGIQHSTRRDICNYGPSHDFVSRRQGRRISRLHIRPEAGRCGVQNRIDHDRQHLIAHRLQDSGKRKAPLPKLRTLKEIKQDSGWDSIPDKQKISKLRQHIVATAKLEKPKKFQQLPAQPQLGKMARPQIVEKVTGVNKPALVKGAEVKPPKVVQKAIPRATPLKDRIKDTPLIAANKPLLQDKRQQPGVIKQRIAQQNDQEKKQQELLRKRADEAKRVKAIEDARRNAIAEQQKQQELLRKRADEAKRVKAIAEQQKQQELLRKRADEDKKAKAIEDARRNAIALQQRQQELLRKRADEAKRVKAIAEQQKQQELLRKRADEAKKARAIEDARRNAIALQQRQQELLRKRADEAKKARAIEDARRNAVAQQQRQQELLRKRADEAKKARAIEDA